MVVRMCLGFVSVSCELFVKKFERVNAMNNWQIKISIGEAGLLLVGKSAAQTAQLRGVELREKKASQQQRRIHATNRGPFCGGGPW